MNKSRMKKIAGALYFIAAISMSIGVLFFFIICTWIGYEVKSACRNAGREYGGDCVTAQSKLLSDENRGYWARNQAIWVLGQLGDRRALPVLEGYYTGNIPDREPLDTVISQYELKKAIALAGGAKNIPAIFWRHGIN